MKSLRNIASLQRLHRTPVWNLLSTDHAPIFIGIMKTHLYDNEKESQLPVTVFIQRVEEDLETVRAQGEKLLQTAAQYVTSWHNRGFLVKRIPPGSDHEVFELSPSTVDAIRFVQGVERPHTAASESRLTSVLRDLSRLTEETDDNKASRLKRLYAERARIDDQIEAVESGSIRVLPYEVAIERLRSIIGMSEDISGDFVHVKDSFLQLHQDLREQVMSHEGGRHEVLQQVFDGIHRIEQSESGRSFLAFWNLLNDPERSSSLDEELEGLLHRKWATKLHPKERAFLRTLKRSLLDRSDIVRREFRHFTQSLERYVRSSDYEQERRINTIVKDAQRAAIEAKSAVKPWSMLNFSIKLTTSRIHSLQIRMHDPSQAKFSGTMEEAPPAEVSLDEIKEAFDMADVDMRALKEDIAEVLKTVPRASVGKILELRPAKQGLGSVMGLIEIGHEQGTVTEEREQIYWTGMDDVPRAGEIPRIHFEQGKFHG